MHKHPAISMVTLSSLAKGSIKSWRKPPKFSLHIAIFTYVAQITSFGPRDCSLATVSSVAGPSHKFTYRPFHVDPTSGLYLMGVLLTPQLGAPSTQELEVPYVSGELTFKSRWIVEECIRGQLENNVPRVRVLQASSRLGWHRQQLSCRGNLYSSEMETTRHPQPGAGKDGHLWRIYASGCTWQVMFPDSPKNIFLLFKKF